MDSGRCHGAAPRFERPRMEPGPGRSGLHALPTATVRAERVFKARVACARVDEEGEPQLPHVAQALERRRVDEPQREWIDADVVPQRVADDFQAFGPAAFTASEANDPNFSKFFLNISA